MAERLTLRHRELRRHREEMELVVRAGIGLAEARERLARQRHAATMSRCAAIAAQRDARAPKTPHYWWMDQ